jgi:hypothetical protein
VAVAFSLTAELQLLARSRADAVTQRTTEAKRSIDATAAVTRLQTDLARHDLARPVAPLAVPVAPACEGDWLKVKSQRAPCISGYELNAQAVAAHGELVRLHASATKEHNASRVGLVASLQSAEVESKSAGTPIVADAGSLAIASYLAALGWHVDAAKVGDWIVLVGVLALEIGSSLAGVLASSEIPVVAKPMRDITPTAEALPVIADHVASRTTRDAAEAIASLARQAGGTLHAESKRQIARLVSVSPPVAGRALALLAAGGVLISADTHGVVVRLAA